MAATYSTAFACTTCRKSFKREFNLAREYPMVLPCPECGGKSFNLGRHFKAPKNSDKTQWLKVAFLVQNGFWFQRIRPEPNSPESVPYPETLEQAKTFVATYKRFALKDYEQYV